MPLFGPSTVVVPSSSFMDNTEQEQLSQISGVHAFRQENFRDSKAETLLSSAKASSYRDGHAKECLKYRLNFTCTFHSHEYRTFSTYFQRLNLIWTKMKSGLRTRCNLQWLQLDASPWSPRPILTL